jgi:hypothetical protein
VPGRGTTKEALEVREAAPRGFLIIALFVAGALSLGLLLGWVIFG